MGVIPTDAAAGSMSVAGRARRPGVSGERLPSVTGIDIDLASIEWPVPRDDDIDYVHGDFTLVDLPEASFDVVTAVAVMHHVDLRVGRPDLQRWCDPEGCCSWWVWRGAARCSTSLATAATRWRSADTPSPRRSGSTCTEALATAVDVFAGAHCRSIGSPHGYVRAGRLLPLRPELGSCTRDISTNPVVDSGASCAGSRTDADGMRVPVTGPSLPAWCARRHARQ